VDGQAVEQAVDRPAVVGNIAGPVVGILAVALVDAVAENKILAVPSVEHLGWGVGLAVMVAVLDSTPVEVVASAALVAHTTQSAS